MVRQDRKVSQDDRDEKAPHVLVVEDDDTLAAEIVAELESRGFKTDRAADGREALATARSGQFDIFVMDRMLPHVDGLSVIEELRQSEIMTPVLVLSALSAVDERVQGFKAGGDDYLVKPFAMDELAARLEALLRRPNSSRATKLRVGPLEMDLIDRKVDRMGREVDLLPREFRLLEYLMRRPNQVLTRTMLLEDVWNYRFIPQTNLVDVHIGKLRRKVDAPGETPLIHSIRGAGFMMRIQD